MKGFFQLADLVTADEAAALRERVRPRLAAYGLPDRARYQLDETHDEPELFARLEALAADRLGAPVARVRARWTRLARGDYALYKDDARRWAGQDRHAELCMDFSAAASNEGQIVYTAEDGGAVIAQRPGAGAVVDRRRPVFRYERYLSIRFGDGEIFRLGLVLAVG